MKRKFTKTISCLLIAVLLLLFASACSKESDTNSKNDNLDSFNDEYSSASEPTLNSSPEHLTEVPNGYIGIYTVEDLQNSTLNTDANYILINDLDLSSIDDWKGIDNSSIFDGNNYTVSNLKSTKSGLFIRADTIHNLSVIDIDISINDRNSDDIGGLANHAKKVENCSSNGTITVSETHNFIDIGGLIGETCGDTIKDCTSSVKINHTSTTYNTNIGGILGYFDYTNLTNNNYLSIENCKFSGTICAKNAVIGGIVGCCNNEVRISYSSNTGNLKGGYSADSKYADYDSCTGGIIGLKNYGSGNIIIENCFNTGTITGTISKDIDINQKSINHQYYFGGIIGKCHSDLNIHNCYNSALVDIQNNIANIGGITGNEYPDGLYITNCAYLQNDSYGVTSTKAMFENCKAMTDNEMKDIKYYPFDNINEWINTENAYPVYNNINAQ